MHGSINQTETMTLHISVAVRRGAAEFYAFGPEWSVVSCQLRPVGLTPDRPALS